MFDSENNKEFIVKDFVESIKNIEDNDFTKMYDAIQQAKHEWEFAQSYFDCVSDPELVEYAIYNQKAAEQKYEYLIKQAKELKLMK